jgi:hypothetical protein
VAKELSRAKAGYREPFAGLRVFAGCAVESGWAPDCGKQEIFKNVGVRSRRTQGGHEGLQAGVELWLSQGTHSAELPRSVVSKREWRNWPDRSAYNGGSGC